MKISRNLAPTKSDLAELESAFARYAVTQIPNLPDQSADQPFLFSALEGARFVGGICGKVYWNGLEIEILWIDEACRGCGYGSRLLAEAEAFAREHGAVIAFLKTVEAQAFYLRHGYRVYGTLEDRPIGTILYHLKKRLDDPGLKPASDSRPID